MARYVLDEEEKAAIEDLDADELRVALEENLLKRRKLVQDRKAYVDGVNAMVAELDARTEHVLDTTETRRREGTGEEKATEKRTGTGRGRKGKGQPAAQAA